MGQMGVLSGSPLRRGPESGPCTWVCGRKVTSEAPWSSVLILPPSSGDVDGSRVPHSAGRHDSPLGCLANGNSGLKPTKPKEILETGKMKFCSWTQNLNGHGLAQEWGWGGCPHTLPGGSHVSLGSRLAHVQEF